MRRYFFMEAGDWADSLVRSLQDAASQRSVLHQHGLQDMLDSSFKSTSAEHDAGPHCKSLLTVLSSNAGSNPHSCVLHCIHLACRQYKYTVSLWQQRVLQHTICCIANTVHCMTGFQRLP